MNKKNNNKGFTLAELLIVVAIIAVLVAIAIPVFTSQLEKSREATDAANIRSSYAELMTEVIANSTADTSRKVELKQQVEDWQNADNSTSLGELAKTEDAAKGVMGVEVKITGDNKPSKTNKYCHLVYDADGGTKGLGKVSISIGAASGSGGSGGSGGTGGTTGGGTTGGSGGTGGTP